MWTSVDPNEKELMELGKICISTFSFLYITYFHIALIQPRMPQLFEFSSY